MSTLSRYPPQHEPEPARCRSRLAEALATAFLARTEAGGRPTIAAWSGWLRDDAIRHAFSQIVEDALEARQEVPQHARATDVLDGRWRLDDRLGSDDADGRFRGVDLRSGDPVAIKLLECVGSEQPASQGRFVRETRALAAFGHPGIAAVQAIGRDGDIRFIVTDQIDGVSLARLLQLMRAQVETGRVRDRRMLFTTPPNAGDERASGRDAIPASLARRPWCRAVAAILADVAAIVEDAHACGVLHRGLNPANIMLRPDGSAVVLDFGLSLLRDNPDARLGPNDFDAWDPHASGQAHPASAHEDLRGDVSQLGQLLRHALETMSPDFACSEASSGSQAAPTGGAGPRLRVARIPAELEAICRKAVDVLPERQYQTAAELREDLLRFVRGHDVPLAACGSRADSLGLRVRYAWRRHRTGLLVLMAGVLSALIASGFLAA